MRADLVFILGAAMAAPVQTASTTAAAEDGVRLVCETFCSETKLRTACARLRLVLPGEADEVTGVAKSALATIRRVEVTVFKNGFDKGLYATFPLAGSGTVGQEGLAASHAGQPVPAPALASRPALRAFQIRVVEAGKELPFASDGVTVEGLEPGVTYTWRVGAERSTGGSAVQTVACRAPICPADMVQPRNER